MRNRQEKNGLTVNAIAGTNVVFFGLDLDPEQRPGLRGFGFKRHDKVEGETFWLRGMKTFEKTEPFPAKGGDLLHAIPPGPVVPVVRLQREAQPRVRLATQRNAEGGPHEP
jgi:hypothetical protein